MKRWLCATCGFVYDETLGLPEDGVAPGTPFAELPDDWCCPECGSSKAYFDVE